jgi:hypothetical protein
MKLQKGRSATTTLVVQRMTVENIFGGWKGRFTRFSKRLDMKVASVVDVVRVSCVLHNRCELQKNEFMPNWKEVDAFEDAIVHACMCMCNIACSS